MTTETWLPRSVDQAFAFFADAANLEALTPPWLHFRILTPLPIMMAQGTLIDYTLRLHGVPIRWQTEIALWEPPHRFLDRQLRGPYRCWEHTHTFESHNGGTRVRDSVIYRVPGGRLVERIVVRPDLRRIFHYRQRRIVALLSENETPTYAPTNGSTNSNPRVEPGSHTVER